MKEERRNNKSANKVDWQAEYWNTLPQLGLFLIKTSNLSS
jgi:hypothetical protein